jgi:hypothetical protein
MTATMARTPCLRRTAAYLLTVSASSRKSKPFGVYDICSCEVSLVVANTKPTGSLRPCPSSTYSTRYGGSAGLPLRSLTRLPEW